MMLIIPLVTASVEDFMGNVNLHPTEYEILYQGMDPEIISVIEDFVDLNGISLVTEFDETKKTIVINANEILPIDSISLHLVSPRENYYLEEEGSIIKIYLKELSEQFNINEKHEILLEFFNFLNNPEENVFLISFEQGVLTKYVEQNCEQLNEKDIYEKETFTFREVMFEEKCVDKDSNKLYELSCYKNQAIFNVISCVEGCNNGKCKRSNTFGTFTSLIANILMRNEIQSKTTIINEIKEWINK